MSHEQYCGHLHYVIPLVIRAARPDFSAKQFKILSGISGKVLDLVILGGSVRNKMSIPFWYFVLFAMSPMRLSKLTLERLMLPCKHCILQDRPRRSSLEGLVDIFERTIKINELKLHDEIIRWV